MSPKAQISQESSPAAAAEPKKYDRAYRNPKAEQMPQFAQIAMGIFGILFGVENDPSSQYYWVGRGRAVDGNGYLVVDLYRDLKSEAPNFRIHRDGRVCTLQPMTPPQK